LPSDRPGRRDLRDERTLYRIEDEITRCWLPRFRARLAAGQSAEFGAVALSPEGVRYRRRVFPWQRVAGAEYKVRNPGPGEKKPGSGTRLHLYVREPGRSDLADYFGLTGSRGAWKCHSRRVESNYSLRDINAGMRPAGEQESRQEQPR
jgi:hypothetical protein